MASIINEIVSVIVKLVITVAGTAFMDLWHSLPEADRYV